MYFIRGTVREVIATGKTVEEATAEACRQLGLSREEVSIEILEMPARRLFRSTPAKVRATAEDAEPEQAKATVVRTEEKKEAPKAAPVEKPAEPEVRQPEAPKAEEPAVQPVQQEEEEAAQTAAEKAHPAELTGEVLDKVNAAKAYLAEVFAAMGAEGLEMTVHQVGEAIIIKVDGKDVGMLIGHRGETMENLSYLASLVANRMPGEYIKLGLDVAGYRSKREKDLQALARRIAGKVAKSGRNYVMEPMNPYERRIIHSTVSGIEGVRSESRGEGADRRVVIYSTDPNARNNERSNDRRRSNGRGGRDGRRSSGYNKGGFKGERRSSVPAREFADEPRPEGAEPMAPKRTQLIDDAAGFELYGKIEL